MLNGKPVDIANPTVALSMGIGMVHQHFYAGAVLDSCRKSCPGQRADKGIVMDYNQAVKSTEEIAQKYNLPVDPRARIKELPVGMRTARRDTEGTVSRGKAFDFLDSRPLFWHLQETDELFRQLKNLRDQGHTIIFISKLREIKEICDRITIMRAGALCWSI